MTTLTTDDSLLFIASTNASIEDLCKTGISTGKYIHCTFSSSQFNSSYKSLLKKRNALGIHFTDGVSFYHPFE